MWDSILCIRPPIPRIRNGAIFIPASATSIFSEQLFNTAKYPSSRGLKTSDFRWQVANAQPAGTSETSQVATDHIDNPNVINNIAYLNFRPKHLERTADGVEREVYHVLKDGADSVGSACLDDPTPRPGVTTPPARRLTRLREHRRLRKLLDDAA